MKSIEEIISIKSKVEGEWLKLPEVSGVGIGYELDKKGDKTEERNICVFVKNDKDVARMKKKMNKSVEGVKIAVVQREFVLHSRMMRVLDIERKADTGSYDPLRGGISIGPCRSVYYDEENAACNGAPGPGWYTFVGTLGAFVRDNDTGAIMMLSNFHVMAVDNNWSVGDTIAQPSRVDGGNCPTDVVGNLQRAIINSQVDAAVANHTARSYDCSIAEIGDVAGTATARVGMAVRKRGCTTGLTHGTVDTTNLSVSIDYCNGIGNVVLTNQIGIAVDPAQSSQFGNSGDSGSVVVDNNRNVVGLYFAGTPDGTYGIANPIDVVLSSLNVSMCTKVKKNEPDIKKNEPDIKKNEPDIKKNEPDIKKNEPDIKKNEPDIKKNEPDIKKNEPDIKKNEPDIKKNEPDIKKNEPDIKKNEPDIKKNEPDIKKNEPDIKKKDPDIKKNEPDIKKNDPDIKKNEPDIK
ncbi:MAG: hypothetical protein AAF990_25795, partial [Bacteroidota bacterium]